ncbi:MAG: aminopeptidase PepB [Pseudomonadota bacterium]
MLKISLNTKQTSHHASYIQRATNLLIPVDGGFEISIDEHKQDSLRVVQSAGRKLLALGYSSFELIGRWPREHQYAFAQAVVLPESNREILYVPDLNQEDTQWLDAHIGSLEFVRSLVNLSPEALSPQNLAAMATNWLATISDNTIESRMIEGEALLEHGFHGIFEVGRGSERPPVMLELDFNPEKTEAVDFALVGKGITYDSGGYSIKSSEGMLDMKCDMAGAATVIGALGLAIKCGLKKRVKVYLCCAENLISGHAYKLGDIITYKNGLSVEIVNTDAEGRLVLADGLIAASEAGAERIIDAATLTGAAVAALGTDYNALFSLHDEFANEALDVSCEVNEPLWRLPLAPFHQNKCPSPFADTANSRPQKGGGAGGASNAAGFLSRFINVNQAQWLHIDLAAAYARHGNDQMAEGGSALGIRTIAGLLMRSQ